LVFAPPLDVASDADRGALAAATKAVEGALNDATRTACERARVDDA
jgi:hypothetical protein